MREGSGVTKREVKSAVPLRRVSRLLVQLLRLANHIGVPAFVELSTTKRAKLP
jgi:hypothetical protein